MILSVVFYTLGFLSMVPSSFQKYSLIILYFLPHPIVFSFSTSVSIFMWTFSHSILAALLYSQRDHSHYLLWWLMSCAYLAGVFGWDWQTLSKLTALHNVGGPHPISWKIWTEQKYWPYKARGNSPAGCLWTSTAPLALLGLYLASSHYRF